jgi:tetratricopeptide (TPR) repeat protein
LPVRFIFADGGHQDIRSNRFQKVQILETRGSSALKEVVIDPDNRLAMLKELPPRNINTLIRDIKKAYRRSDEIYDLDLYNDAIKLKLTDKRMLLYLGMLLYGGKQYPQALEIFGMREDLADSESDHFLNNAWLGLLHDLRGQRDLALNHYKISLKNAGTRQMQHGQYQLKLDKAWLEQRIKTPYKR